MHLHFVSLLNIKIVQAAEIHDSYLCLILAEDESSSTTDADDDDDDGDDDDEEPGEDEILDEDEEAETTDTETETGTGEAGVMANTVHSHWFTIYTHNRHPITQQWFTW